MQAALQKLTGVKINVGNTAEYLRALDTVPELPLRLPFNFSRLIVVYEKIPVLHEVFAPKPSSFLQELLADAPGEPFLITDPGFQSAESLFVVMQCDIADSLHGSWMEMMIHAKVLLNEHPRFGALFATALTSFYDARR